MTEREFEILKEKLAAMPSDALAAFIAEIAVTSERVHEAARMFVERQKPSNRVGALRKQLRSFESNDRFYHYREARQLENRLDDWLDRIANDLLPHDPAAALELLGCLFKADAKIYGKVDDSGGGVGMCFHRAAELMASASTRAGRPAAAGRWLRDLAQANDYGVRDYLYQRAADFLPADEIRSLVETWRGELVDEASGDDFDYRRLRLRTLCAQFARAIPDPELYAEIRLEGRGVDEMPAFAMEVAELFLNAGQPGRALDFLPEIREGPRSEQLGALKIRILEALGESEAAQEIRWKRFLEHPSDATSKEYLNHLPKAERADARKRMRAVVDAGEYAWRTKARFYLAQNDRAAAAAVVETQHEAVRQADYYTQADMAGRLVKSHPLAATILLRGSAEQTVAQSKSKYYHHAVRYILKLEMLAEQIDDWGEHPNHSDWFAAFIEQHRRKAALVGKLKDAGVGL